MLELQDLGKEITMTGDFDDWYELLTNLVKIMGGTNSKIVIYRPDVNKEVKLKLEFA